MSLEEYAIRYQAGKEAERIDVASDEPVEAKTDSLLDSRSHKSLRILVWNIYKQKRADWLPVLAWAAKDAHLVMLQEAQSTPDLIKFATNSYTSTDQVPALTMPKHASGVMTLASAYAFSCCPLKEMEPLLRMPKSALITTYPLKANWVLMVVNVHAVNFTFGVDSYNEQLTTIGEMIYNHDGPVIMAGDFNAWSRRRINALYDFASHLKLSEVHFTPDHRKKALGRPLDFVFQRDLIVEDARVLITKASDHNPLMVQFAV